MSGPDDADALRGRYFRELLREGPALASIGAATLGVGLVVGGGTTALGGLLAAVATALVGAAIVFWIADSRAAEAFFEVYAKERGLALGERSDLAPVTPLLCKGAESYANRTLAGELADGIEGTLALYTYEERTYNGNQTQTSYYNYTLGLIEIPECAALVPELYCQRKFGLRALEKFEDVFRGSKQRLELESDALDDRYEIFAAKGQDANWLRRLFEPTFIVWLTESAPEKFAFELVGGNLCCYVSGHKDSAAELDAVAAASATVAKRLREETRE